MKEKISKLKNELKKVEAKLDNCRTSALDDGRGTMRYARKSRNWDYYAQEKTRLKWLIEDEMEKYIVEREWYKYYGKHTYVHEDIKIMLNELGVFNYIPEHTNAQFTIGEAYETQVMYEDSIKRKIHGFNITK